MLQAVKTFFHPLTEPMGAIWLLLVCLCLLLLWRRQRRNAAWALTSAIITKLGICDTTHDEALHCAELAVQKRWTRILLVTSALHLPRAVAVFRRQGLMVVPVGCDFKAVGISSTWSLIPSLQRFELWALYLHEKVGWWVYRWRGWI